MNKGKVVTIGGGTGSSVLLQGLKNYTENITAIVTVADDGGGSGYLREDLGMLAPGDIRACLIALSDSEEEMSKIMGYRFSEDSGRLAGQSFGNIFLAALTEIYHGFDKGIKSASRILNITGKVLPMTLENVILYAELEDGSVIEGESNISFLIRKNGGRIKKVFLDPPLSKPPSESTEAIMEADLIVLGPGSLYTSVMPNLLVDDLREAVLKSPGKKVYIGNIMTQPGETAGYSLTDHIDSINRHAGQCFLDYILINNKKLPDHLKHKYKYKDGSEQILVSGEEVSELKKQGCHVIEGDFLDTSYPYARHNAMAVSESLMEILAGKI